jgi:hypothetical protein
MLIAHSFETATTTEETAMAKKVELKTKATGVNPETFIESVADENQREDAHTLVKLMSAATKAPAKMWGPSIIGFGASKLTYPNGSELDWMQIAFSPRKGATVLYLTCDISEYEELLANLGKHKTGKGCLYIKRLSDVDMKVLKTLIARAAKAKR